MVDKGLLTPKQVHEVKSFIETTAAEETLDFAPQDLSSSLTITFSDGGLMEIPILQPEDIYREDNFDFDTDSCIDISDTPETESQETTKNSPVLLETETLPDSQGIVISAESIDTTQEMPPLFDSQDLSSESQENLKEFGYTSEDLYFRTQRRDIHQLDLETSQERFEEVPHNLTRVRDESMNFFAKQSEMDEQAISLDGLNGETQSISESKLLPGSLGKIQTQEGMFGDTQDNLSKVETQDGLFGRTEADTGSHFNDVLFGKTQDDLTKSHEDLELGRLAVQKNLISISDLQSCIAERQKLSQQGQSISLRNLLVERNLVSKGKLESIMNEAPTRAQEPIERNVENQELLVGKYRVIKKLGSGGMGAVYKIEHVMLEHNKYFALKVMHPSFIDNQNSYKRFVREVEVAMGLMHKNIIAIREFGVLPDRGPYLTMDFSSGQGLDIVLKENWTKDIGISLHIIRQILDGLAEAHKNKVIHRDLKPANILIETNDRGDKIVKIVDFGLAKLVEESENVESITHGVIGTPLYMSPEQASGEKVDQTSDLYAVGIILYEMLAGTPPFRAKSLRQMLAKQLFEKPRPPREVNPNIPEELEDIILKAIEKDPKNRFHSAAEFMEAIDSLTSRTTISLSDQPLKVSRRKKKTSWRKRSLKILFVFLVLLGGTYYFLDQRGWHWEKNQKIYRKYFSSKT